MVDKSKIKVFNDKKILYNFPMLIEVSSKVRLQMGIIRLLIFLGIVKPPYTRNIPFVVFLDFLDCLLKNK